MLQLRTGMHHFRHRFFSFSSEFNIWFFLLWNVFILCAFVMLLSYVYGKSLRDGVWRMGSFTSERRLRAKRIVSFAVLMKNEEQIARIYDFENGSSFDVWVKVSSCRMKKNEVLESTIFSCRVERKWWRNWRMKCFLPSFDSHRPCCCWTHYFPLGCTYCSDSSDWCHQPRGQPRSGP